MLHYSFLETHYLDTLNEQASQARKTCKMSSSNKMSSGFSVSTLGSRKSSRNAGNTDSSTTLDGRISYKPGFGLRYNPTQIPFTQGGLYSY